MKRLLFLLCTASFCNQPPVIDVVMLCRPQEVFIISTSIAYLRRHVQNIRRVIVVSSPMLVPIAEWFDERQYPFSRSQIAQLLYQDSTDADGAVVDALYRKFLKLYAPLVIPNIAPCVLVVDANVVFLQDMHCIDNYGYAQYDGTAWSSRLYTDYGQCLLPGYKKVALYGTARNKYMVMERVALEEFFEGIRAHHECEPWQAMCKCLKGTNGHTALSEYELYINFALSKGYPGIVEPAYSKTVKYTLAELHKAEQQGYEYVTVTIPGE